MSGQYLCLECQVRFDVESGHDCAWAHRANHEVATLRARLALLEAVERAARELRAYEKSGRGESVPLAREALDRALAAAKGR